MTSLNTISLIGRVINDPDVKVTSNGTPFAKFSMGVDRPTSASTGIATQDRILIVCWGDASDIVKSHCQNGSMVLVQGRISEHSYEDANGQRHWVTEVETRQVVPLDTNSPAPSDNETPTVDVVPGPIAKESDFNFSDPFQSGGETTETDSVQEDVPF